MAVKLRLARHGRGKRPFYHIVAADARASRDGKFIEKLGTYNPLTVPATIELNDDATFEWLQKGAIPTNTVRAILAYRGLMFKKHLYRGVRKGAMTQEQADAKYQDFLAEKLERVRAHENKVAKAKDDAAQKVFEAETKKREAKEAEVAAKLAAASAAAAEATAAEAGDEPTSEADAISAAIAGGSGDDVVGITEAPAEEAKEEAPAEEAKAEEAPAEEAKEEAPAEEAKAEEAPAEEAKEEAPKEEPKAEEAPKEEAAAAPAADAKPDDLTKIEGIGPKIAETLNAAGIGSFADLASKSADDVKSILEAAEGNFAAHDPGTWPKQSGMAAEGKWDELKEWQDKLDGGKEPA